MREVPNKQETVKRNKFSSEISPKRHEQHTKEKLAPPLPVERAGNPLPQQINNRRSEIPPVNKETNEVRIKPPVYATRTNGMRQQINYDHVNWD